MFLRLQPRSAGAGQDLPPPDTTEAREGLSTKAWAPLGGRLPRRSRSLEEVVCQWVLCYRTGPIVVSDRFSLNFCVYVLPPVMPPGDIAVRLGRIPQLDGIRGLAVLFVLTYHFRIWFPLPEGGVPVLSRFGWLFSLTWTGVDLFFVLSGFLIGGVVLDNRDARNFFTVFYVRRCTRILPCYLLLLGAFLLAAQLAAPPPRGHGLGLLLDEGQPTWTYGVFVQNLFMAATGVMAPPLWLAPTWSLAVEEQFYLVLPALLRVCPARVIPHVLGGLVVAAPAIRIATYLVADSAWVRAYVLLPCRMDALLLGVLGAWAIRQPRLRESILNRRRHLVGLFLVLGGVLTGFSWAGYDFGSAAIITVGYTCVAAFYLLFILIGTTSRHRWTVSAYSFGPLRGLGTISYFVYLFHVAILGLAGAFLWGGDPWSHGPRPPSWWLLPPTVLALTILCGAVSWRVVEQPFIALGHRLRYARASDGDGGQWDAGLRGPGDVRPR